MYACGCIDSLYLCQAWKIWYIFEKDIALIVVVHLAAVVVETVAYDQIIYFQNHIISGNLVEYFLRNLYIGSLVFYNHFGLCCVGKYYGVASF